MKRNIKRLTMGLLLTSSLVLSYELVVSINTPTIVEAKMESTTTDPSVGKASKEIETAIAKGKEFIGKDYAWGGGHGVYPDCDGGGLDCSGFVRQAYLQGIGVDIGGGTTHEIARVFSKYIISGDKAERGDLLFDENKGHFVILLDQETWTHIGSDGGVSGAFCTVDPAGGVRISNPYWEGSASEAIDMSAVIADGFLPVDKSAITGLTTPLEESTDKAASESYDGKINMDWKEPLVMFNDLQVVSTVKGLVKGDEFSERTLTLANSLSNGIYDALNKLMIVLGFLLLSYTTVMAIIYMAILPRGGSIKLNDYYEKMTGRSSAVTRAGSIDNVIAVGISSMFLTLVVSGGHLVLLGWLYNMVSNVLSYMV